MLQHQIRDIFLLRKFELFIKRRVHFTFCSCPSTLGPFHGLQDSTSPFSCQFHRPPIFQQCFGGFRLQHSGSDRSDCFSGNCLASYSKIMQNHFDFCGQFLGDHTRMSGTFKSDFFSRFSFFVYVLSAIQIAPITNRFSFKFITLAAVFFCLFLLHRCFQFSCNTHLSTGHYTGLCLQRFAK